MKNSIEVNLESKIDHEGDIVNIKESGEGYLEKSGDILTIFFKIKKEKYKYVYQNNELEIIKEDAYKIKLNRNKRCDFKLKLLESSMDVTSKTELLNISENKVIAIYTLFTKGLKIGNYQSELTYNIKKKK